MFSLSVPGTSVPGHEHPDAIVVGGQLDIVDALLSAGMDNVVLACSSDALRHALIRATGPDVLLILDAHGGRPMLQGLRAPEQELQRCTVLVRGTHLDAGDSAALKHAKLTIWCADGISPAAIAHVACRRMAA